MSRAKALMIQGCSSNAGKSYLVAGFCRLFANRGVKVMPFKAQNMSNNAGVTKAGLEMGRAQLLQAQAAKVDADVRMNPVLLKPEADTRSQVIVKGVAQLGLSEIPWMERKAYLWEHVQESLWSLMNEADLVMIEGAGSPAEINLKEGDIVNMAVAKEVGAAVLLASDIDRGGSFAHLLGTWHCLDDDEKKLLQGFLLNKFRGDPALLGNAMDWLEARTNVPTVGIVPMLRLPLPEEDAFSLDPDSQPLDKPVIAVVLLPHMSNFDEFDALVHEPNASLRFIRHPDELKNADMIILPGSKHVAHDLTYLRESGLAAAIYKLTEKNIPLLGICGGLQMLGTYIHDPTGVEAKGTVEALGLLDIETVMQEDKTTRQTTATVLETKQQASGYEIHHGQTVIGSSATPFLSDNLGFRQKNVTGVYLHGLFEETSFRAHMLAKLGVASSLKRWQTVVDTSLDELAGHLEAHCDIAKIEATLGGSFG